ncbi:enoyl-CoA hydratase/isomerase family protein [Rhodococcus sp. CX]|uniref:enoyl-CoA hydratase-related protein n=1 Tax=Rhodococcus sp. CX TaxID=2789880 RepID=UPI0018CCBC3B|nr:enoyl-CoA hydratase-related protein [Rhodococcus sp. CX]MBH0121598.1 enoyl-CoA hydratase/isomerase family protein [Rhodococcus sp. CX]
MPVRQDLCGKVLVITLDREKKRNAIDPEMAVGISAALDRLDDDEDIWVGVITGGDSVFCAGSDLKDGAQARTERGGEYGIIRRRRVKPLIAAVEGPALGGGFEIALACDLIVASTTARFALPETQRGVVATSGALFRAIRALPIHVAKQLLITQEGLTAERAFQLGLVSHVTEPGDALRRAQVLADEICRSAPVAVRQTLAAIASQYEEADERGWKATARAITAVKASDDMAEGIAAFFERRAPQWRGR